MTAILLADIGDVIGVIVFVIVALISVVGQMLAKQREAKQMQAGRPQRPRPAAVDEVLEDEIGDFLRRVSGGRARQAGKGIPKLVKPVAAKRPLQRPVEAQLVEPPRPAVGGHIGQFAARDLDRSDLQYHLARLGEGTRQAEEASERRLHEKFSHSLGTLSRREDEQIPQATQAALPPTTAAGLAAMLGEIENVRLAVILNEIIQRPEHRWS